MTPSSKVSRYFKRMEGRIRSEPQLDYETLSIVHQFWEFVAENDLEFDAWLHAHIRRAKK